MPCAALCVVLYTTPLTFAVEVPPIELLLVRVWGGLLVKLGFLGATAVLLVAEPGLDVVVGAIVIGKSLVEDSSKSSQFRLDWCDKYEWNVRLATFNKTTKI